MARFADFDAARKERQAQREPLKIRLFDRDWTLPATVPAETVLIVARLIGDLRDEYGELSPGAVETMDIRDEQLVAIAESAIPDDTLKAWFAKGLEVDDLGDVLRWAMGEWDVAGQAEKADLDPEVPAPTGATPGPSASGSSTIGRASRPTSLASTGST